MHARVDRRVGAVAGLDLAHDGQPGKEVGQSARRQRGTPCCELQEGLALAGAEGQQHVDELDKGRRFAAVAQFGLRVFDDVVLGEDRALVAAQHRFNLQRTEGAQLVHREDGVEAGLEGLHLSSDASVEGEVQRQGQILFDVVRREALLVGLVVVAQVYRVESEDGRTRREVEGQAEVFQPNRIDGQRVDHFFFGVVVQVDSRLNRLLLSYQILKDFIINKFVLNKLNI